MGLWDIRPFRSPLGGTTTIRTAPMKASETFLPGELIYIDSNGQAVTLPADGTQALLADVSSTGVEWGLALNGPGAASSAARPSSAVMLDSNTGSAYATGALIKYVPAGIPGQTFIGIALVAGGASGQSVAVPNTSRGIIYELSYESASTPDVGWGVELTAGTAATDLLAKVIDIYNASWRRTIIGDTDGKYIEFEMNNSTFIS